VWNAAKNNIANPHAPAPEKTFTTHTTNHDPEHPPTTPPHTDLV